MQRSLPNQRPGLVSSRKSVFPSIIALVFLVGGLPCEPIIAGIAGHPDSWSANGEHAGWASSAEPPPGEAWPEGPTACLPDEGTPEPPATARAFSMMSAAGAIPLLGNYVVRTAYIIPEHRRPQPDAVANLQWALAGFQSWYRDQMVRYGFEPKTFRFETEEDGQTPRIHTIQVPVTESHLRANPWVNATSAAHQNGVPLYSRGEIWWLIPEAHLQAPDGSISGGVFLGRDYGAHMPGGIAMVGSDALARFAPAFLTEDEKYDGQVIPEIGSYPLVQSVSFPWFEGTTFSSTSSSVLGGSLHELSHALGLFHDFRDDENFKGNLMGNGLRGYRGSLVPELYSTDDCRLSYGAALVLNHSRYFNPNRAYQDNWGNRLKNLTPESLTPVAGAINIRFYAQDEVGIAAAWLIWNGHLVDELPISGESFTGGFDTPYYTAGALNDYAIIVFNQEGDKQGMGLGVFVEPGFNRAPRPFLRIHRSVVRVGETVYITSGNSYDPDESNNEALTTTWDLNADGTDDTLPTFSKDFLFQFESAGDWLVRAHVSDPQGATSASSLIPIRVLPPPAAKPIGPGGAGYDSRRNPK